MMASLPLSAHPTAPRAPAGPAALVSVRIASGRTAEFSLNRGELLIGGAEGCDIRLPGSQIPSLVGQLIQDSSGVQLRRLVPTFPVLHNGSPLTGSAPQLLKTGDRIAIGSADITLDLPVGEAIRPQFVPIEPELFHSPVTVRNGESEREQLRIQTEELEADRVAWYRRRQDLESEFNRMQDRIEHAQSLEARDAELHRRESELRHQEAELEKVRTDLHSIRDGFLKQFQDRRDQLEAHQKNLALATEAFEKHQRHLEQDWQTRRQRLELTAEERRAAIDEEVQRLVAEREIGLLQRRQDLEAEFGRKLAEWQSDADRRRIQFAEDLERLEPRRAESDAQREALAAGFRELQSQRNALDAQRGELALERHTHEAERQWHEERRREYETRSRDRENILAEREARADAERAERAEAQSRHAADLVRLDRWQAELQAKSEEIDSRRDSIEIRHEQMLRDVAEFEEHLSLADVERKEHRRDQDRVRRLESELESRDAALAERAAAVEAQQATLAVLQARLSRQRQEVEADTEAVRDDRARLEAAWAEVTGHLRDAEQLRSSLDSAQSLSSEQEKQLAEERAIFDAHRADINAQREELAASESRLQADRAELDRRTAELAEQAAIFKVKSAQVLELQARLEDDRMLVRDRESNVHIADSARGQFQDQLRRRADDLGRRAKEIDDAAAQLAADRESLRSFHAELELKQREIEQNWHGTRSQFESRDAELARQAAELAEREKNLDRQVHRLRETGQAVAAGKKDLQTSRRQWEIERATSLDEALTKWNEIASFRERASTEAETLLKQTPEFEERARGLFDRLVAARDVLRGQLNELHGYSKESRDTLDALHQRLRNDSEQLRERERAFEQARETHRLSVAEFRQQLHDWQARVEGLKDAMRQSESRIDLKRAELEAATQQSDATALAFARQMEDLRLQKDEVTERREQVEQHLNDMREWYRRKLRELAETRQQNTKAGPLLEFPRAAALDPGDKHLGELLRSLELIDAETLQTLWESAQAQNRTLRQVLLTSGAVTLYQLALIEAGNLDGLMIGRFRIIERLRSSPREASFRVFDPARGMVLLRILGDAEMRDALHPDEYRMRFAAAAEVEHPNVQATLEVLDLNGRPAVVQQWLTGSPSSEWPAAAAHPGLWLKLFTDAARSLAAVHGAGLIHGRLTGESIWLTENGTLKLIGPGEPPWLASGMAPSFDATPESDLRALAPIVFQWSAIQPETKKKGRAKGFPDSLLAVVRRLENDPENPMSDTVSGAAPYRNAAELVNDLEKLAGKFPPAKESWNELLQQLAARSPGVRLAA